MFKFGRDTALTLTPIRRTSLEKRQGSAKRVPSPHNLTATNQTTKELCLKNPTLMLLSWAKGTKLDVPCRVLEQIDKINCGWLGHL